MSNNQPDDQSIMDEINDKIESMVDERLRVDTRDFLYLPTDDEIRSLISLIHQHSGWISVDDQLPDENEEVWWWLVGKPPEECYHDTSGKPICPNSEPYMYCCKSRCWASTMKPSHWQPLPHPPKDYK